MPSQPRTPSSKDAQDVDRLLRNLILEEDAGVPAGRLPARPAATRPQDAPPSAMETWGWVALGGVLAGALTQWPYHTCGVPLGVYLLAVGMVLLSGIWAALYAWRARRGFAHILAILLLFAGAALAADQILPRVGYAAVEASWTCPG